MGPSGAICSGVDALQSPTIWAPMSSQSCTHKV